MRRVRVLPMLLLAALALALALAACGEADSPAEGASVEGSWRMETYLDGDQMKPLLPGSDVTAEFGTEMVAGHAGVNDFSAAYSLKGERIDFSKLDVGDDAGLEQIAGQERAFLEGLERAREYSVEGGRLSLKTKKGVILVTFVRGLEPELVGAWTCTGYSDGKGGLTVPEAGSEPTVEFGEGGAVSGDDGSGTYVGSYDTTGANGLTVSDLEALADAADRTASAKRFTDALRSAAYYELGEATLTLEDAGGETVAVFESAE